MNHFSININGIPITCTIMENRLRFFSSLFVLLTLFPAASKAQTDFEKSAAERGYAPAVADLSDIKSIKIDEPELRIP